MLEHTPPSTVMCDTTTYNNYKVFLCRDIQSPEEHLNELATLYNANDGDNIDIYFNSNGGYLDTAIQFIDAIHRCRGNVVGHLVGSAHSAAGAIFLACHGWVVGENASMLVHMASGGMQGKFPDIALQWKHDESNVKRVNKRAYKYFLSRKELKDMNKGKDFWFNSDEILKRVKIVSKKRTKEYENSSNPAELPK